MRSVLGINAYEVNVGFGFVDLGNVPDEKCDWAKVFAPNDETSF